MIFLGFTIFVKTVGNRFSPGIHISIPGSARTNGTIHGVATQESKPGRSESRASCLFCFLPFSTPNQPYCRETYVFLQTYVMCGSTHICS
jgi:hypothetical protein